MPELGEFGPPTIHSATYMVKNKPKTLPVLGCVIMPNNISCGLHKHSCVQPR